MYENTQTQKRTHHFAVASYQGCRPLSSQFRNLLCMKWTSRNLSFSWKSPGIRRTSLRLAAFEFSGKEHPASCPGRISRRKQFLPSSRCPPLKYLLANNWIRVSADELDTQCRNQSRFAGLWLRSSRHQDERKTWILGRNLLCDLLPLGFDNIAVGTCMCRAKRPHTRNGSRPHSSACICLWAQTR